MDIINPAAGDYLLAHCTPPDDLLRQLAAETREAFPEAAGMQVSHDEVAGVTGKISVQHLRGTEPCQRGEPHPVGRLVPYPAGVAAQHRVLVPEYQQFSILRQVAAEHQDSEADCPAN